MTIRLVLADDHPVVLEGLRHLFSAEADCEVVALVLNGAEALAAVRKFQPDILVLDLRMPVMDGLTVLREIKREGLRTRVVILTAIYDGELDEAVHLGVPGVVFKEMASRFLVQCVRSVYAGGTWLEKSVATRAVDTLRKREAGAAAMAGILTPREIEVARLTAEGRSAKEVADRLSITEGTAKLHLHHVYEKLDLDGRMALLQYMHQHGLG